MDEARAILHAVFGYNQFRPGQQEVISALLHGRDVLAVMPTGAGKSLCYQIPALILPGITLVISPLISLMKDQVNALLQNGVRAAYLNSTLTSHQYLLALNNARRGVYKIIYVAPERLTTNSFLSFAREAQISQVVVDEAHCVSQWGQDFRPKYLKIDPFVRSLPVRPRVGAFTATATDIVRQDTVRLLGLQNPYEITTGFDRPNLYLDVRHPANRDLELLYYLNERKGQSGIVYCTTRKKVDEVVHLLTERGIEAVGYHAGMDDLQRQTAQDDFVSDRVPVIVATNAFGMGIDKSNVSFVLHYNMPKDIESYYQEAGRAGRDGAVAACCLLYHPSDIRLNSFLIDHSQDNNDERLDRQTRMAVYDQARARLREMTAYAVSRTCLRTRILEYFGERPAKRRCGNCSVCLAGYEERDASAAAGVIASTVISLNGRYGKTIVVQMLCGKENERILSRGLDKHKAFGRLSEEGEENVRAIIDKLIDDEVLSVTRGEYPLLQAGPRARTVLRGDEPVYVPVLPKIQRPPAKKSAEDEQSEADMRLFRRLSALRKRLAEEQRVPPFVIFSNATLWDMVMKQPTTHNQMLTVAGIGERKFERYGAAFLAELARFKEEEHG